MKVGKVVKVCRNKKVVSQFAWGVPPIMDSVAFLDEWLQLSRVNPANQTVQSHMIIPDAPREFAGSIEDLVQS